MAGSILYDVSADEERAFLGEFGRYLNDAQLRSIATGARSLTHKIDTSTLPNPDTVDPKTDPVNAYNILMNPKSTLRVGERPFVLPLLSYLTTAQRQVPADIQVLSQQYDIYLIKYGVDAKPKGKEKFAEVELVLDYPNDQGFLTYSMAPDTELEEKFSAKTKVKVGLDTSLKFRVPDVPIQPGMSVGGGVDVSNESDFVLYLEYKLLAAKVIALGMSSSYVEWTIKKPLQMIGSVGLATVLCVPKGIKKLPINVKGYYCLKRGILWWQRETKIDINGIKPIIVPLP